MKYLGIDWGLKRVGLAVSEGDLASPLATLTIGGLKDGVEKVVEVIKRENIEFVVMGLPEGEMGKNVRRAAVEFGKQGIAVKLVDETLSTQEAKKAMLEAGVSRKRRQDDNRIAAVIILQNFLDEQI